MKNSIVITLLIVAGILNAQTDKELAQTFITKEKIESHLYFLAGDEMLGRETGTREELIAAQYLATQLHSYGVQQVPGADGYFQQVPMIKTIPPSMAKLKVNENELPKFVAVNGGNISYNGKAVYLSYGLEADYSGKDVKGKVVYLKGGSETAQSAQEQFQLMEQKRAIAKKMGAKAVVEFLAINPMIWNYIEHAYSETIISLKSDNEDEDEFNYMIALDNDGETANKLSMEQNNEAEITISGSKKEEFNARNVVAMVEGTDPKLKEEFIIYSGHYDHVGVGKPDATGDSIYNGARDNVVGITTVLSMAENLAKYPTKRSALFILFTGEEKGLLGSNYYVNNPLIPQKQTVFCFNSDNAGYNDTSKVTIVGLGRTTAEQDIKVAASAFGLDAIDDPAPEQNLFDRSDNVHFAAAGVPAPTFSMGFTSFSGKLTETYHQPSDNPDTVDYDYLVNFFKSYVLAGRLIANNPVTPFWVSGDKYEAAGKELYQK
ncbi:M28 family peptidase [Planktosalinus lacus]|uniref:M28-family zinc peptidase n=1 Tax=Planktosalinus lacus TaxID=1526573 RepID=A0A8J2VCP1_9FLAO|nr:M28 family peptidase [Planktosalinus lacus]GGD98818.1 M28-family zinc peptidase [Planktosalinus lacus]